MIYPSNVRTLLTYKIIEKKINSRNSLKTIIFLWANLVIEKGSQAVWLDWKIMNNYYFISSLVLFSCDLSVRQTHVHMHARNDKALHMIWLPHHVMYIWYKK
jgi:hypothetical protein